METEDCEQCAKRGDMLVEYDLLPLVGNGLPTPADLLTLIRGHHRVVSPALAEIGADWDEFVIERYKHTLGGYGGTQWYRVSADLLLQVEFFEGCFDRCWGEDWFPGGVTVRVDDPSEGSRCSSVLCFGDHADGVEWAGLLRPDGGFPDLLPQPDRVYRVLDGGRRSTVSAWPMVEARRMFRPQGHVG